MESTIEHSLDIETVAKKGKRWRCQVPSNVLMLEHIHNRCSWVPGLTNIRPTPEVRQVKEEYLDEVMKSYENESAYIWETVFGVQLSERENNGKKHVDEATLRDLPSARKFLPNKYNYCLEEGANHWVMWYTKMPPELTSEDVTKNIEEDLREMIGSDDFEFVWYENPKMTINKVYHVQVFWRKL